MTRTRSRRGSPPILMPPRVAIVGHCASGKSTLVKGLRSAGVDAVVSAQEHSIVADLWRHTQADLLVYLDIDLETLRLRRGESWPANIFELQEARLSEARRQANLVIDAARHRPEDVLRHAQSLIERWRLEHRLA